MDGSAFRGIWEGLVIGFIILAVLAPLGVWKLIEIIIWIYKHVSISIS